MTTSLTQRHGSRTSTDTSWADSKTSWQKRGLHRVTLPSGMRILLRIPDMAKLIQGPDAAVPAHLLQIALREVIDQADAARTLVDQIKAGETDEAVKTIGELNELERWLVTHSVIEPEITVSDIDAGLVPAEDMAMIVAICRRERFMDAAGVTIGVAPLDDFAVFRDAHRCAEGEPETGCKACQKVQQQLSSIDMGVL